MLKQIYGERRAFCLFFFRENLVLCGLCWFVCLPVGPIDGSRLTIDEESQSKSYFKDIRVLCTLLGCMHSYKVLPRPFQGSFYTLKKLKKMRRTHTKKARCLHCIKLFKEKEKEEEKKTLTDPLQAYENKRELELR